MYNKIFSKYSRQHEIEKLIKRLDNLDDNSMDNTVATQVRFRLKIMETQLAAIRLHQSERRLLQQVLVGLLGFFVGTLSVWFTRFY